MFNFKTLLKLEKRHLIRLGSTIQEIAESKKITFIFKKGFCQHDFFSVSISISHPSIYLLFARALKNVGNC
jgi:hypothetical protein